MWVYDCVSSQMFAEKGSLLVIPHTSASVALRLRPDMLAGECDKCGLAGP